MEELCDDLRSNMEDRITAFRDAPRVAPANIEFYGRVSARSEKALDIGHLRITGAVERNARIIGRAGDHRGHCGRRVGTTAEPKLVQLGRSHVARSRDDSRTIGGAEGAEA